MSRKKYALTRNQPVARFFYQAQRHTHPVRRTVLVIESTSTLITGYEMREGAMTRSFGQAPIKSYRRDRIASINEIDSRRTLRKETPRSKQKDTTLVRSDLMSFVTEGI